MSHFTLFFLWVEKRCYNINKSNIKMVDKNKIDKISGFPERYNKNSVVKNINEYIEKNPKINYGFLKNSLKPISGIIVDSEESEKFAKEMFNFNESYKNIEKEALFVSINEDGVFVKEIDLSDVLNQKEINAKKENIKQKQVKKNHFKNK